VFVSVAAVPAAPGCCDEPTATAPALTLVDQTPPPSASDKTRLEVLVSASVGAEEEERPVALIIGVSLLAIHTTVSLGMP